MACTLHRRAGPVAGRGPPVTGPGTALYRPWPMPAGITSGDQRLALSAMRSTQEAPG